MINGSNHLNHSARECKCHVAFTPKYRKKELYGFIRKEWKDVFHRPAKRKGCNVEEGYLMLDRAHMLVSVPPKHSVSSILGFLKGKSSIWIAQNVAGTMEGGSLESSNVDIETQLTNLVIAQNAYQFNSKLVSTTSTMLQDLISMDQ